MALPAGVTGKANVSVDVSGEYKQAFLSFLQPKYYYVGYGKRGSMMDLPSNSGTTVTWDRPNLLTPALTAMGEYVTPAPLGTFSTTPVVATIARYGDHLLHSDEMVKFALNRGLLAKMRDVQAVQHRNTMDQLARNAITAGTWRIYADGTARASVASVLTIDHLNAAITYLWSSDVEPITKKVTPSQLVGTVGLMPAYIGLGHVHLWPTFAAMILAGTMVSVTKYANPGAALEGEIGCTSDGRLRVILSTNGKVWSGAGADVDGTLRNNNDDNDGTGHADVYGFQIFGQEYYGETKLGGAGLNVIVKAPGESGDLDPHNQRGSLAWNQYVVYTILDNARGVRIECCAPTLSETIASAEI